MSRHSNGSQTVVCNDSMLHNHKSGRFFEVTPFVKKLLETAEDGCDEEMPSYLATDITRYFNTNKPECLEKTKEFVNKIRASILFLHNYNLEVAKVKDRYPKSEQFFSILTRYIELEQEIFCRNQMIDKNEEKLQIQKVFRLLHMIFLEIVVSNTENLIEIDKIVCCTILSFLAIVRNDYKTDDTLIGSIVRTLFAKVGVLSEIYQIKDQNIPLTHVNNPLVQKVKQTLSISNFKTENSDYEHSDHEDDNVFSSPPDYDFTKIDGQPPHYLKPTENIVAIIELSDDDDNSSTHFDQNKFIDVTIIKKENQYNNSDNLEEVNNPVNHGINGKLTNESNLNNTTNLNGIFEKSMDNRQNQINTDQTVVEAVLFENFEKQFNFDRNNENSDIFYHVNTNLNKFVNVTTANVEINESKNIDECQTQNVPETQMQNEVLALSQTKNKESQVEKLSENQSEIQKVSENFVHMVNKNTDNEKGYFGDIPNNILTPESFETDLTETYVNFPPTSEKNYDTEFHKEILEDELQNEPPKSRVIENVSKNINSENKSENKISQIGTNDEIFQNDKNIFFENETDNEIFKSKPENEISLIDTEDKIFENETGNKIVQSGTNKIFENETGNRVFETEPEIVISQIDAENEIFESRIENGISQNGTKKIIFENKTDNKMFVTEPENIISQTKVERKIFETESNSKNSVNEANKKSFQNNSEKEIFKGEMENEKFQSEPENDTSIDQTDKNESETEQQNNSVDGFQSKLANQLIISQPENDLIDNEVEITENYIEIFELDQKQIFSEIKKNEIVLEKFVNEVENEITESKPKEQVTEIEINDKLIEDMEIEKINSLCVTSKVSEKIPEIQKIKNNDEKSELENAQENNSFYSQNDEDGQKKNNGLNLLAEAAINQGSFSGKTIEFETCSQSTSIKRKSKTRGKINKSKTPKKRSRNKLSKAVKETSITVQKRMTRNQLKKSNETNVDIIENLIIMPKLIRGTLSIPPAHNFMTSEDSVKNPFPTNNVYDNKKCIESNINSEEGNDSCENSLCIDLGEAENNFDEDTISDDLIFFKTTITQRKPLNTYNVSVIDDNQETLTNFNVETTIEENANVANVLNVYCDITNKFQPNSSIDFEICRNSRQTDHSINSILNKSDSLENSEINKNKIFMSKGALKFYSKFSKNNEEKQNESDRTKAITLENTIKKLSEQANKKIIHKHFKKNYLAKSKTELKKNQEIIVIIEEDEKEKPRTRSSSKSIECPEKAEILNFTKVTAERTEEETNSKSVVTKVEKISKNDKTKENVEKIDESNNFLDKKVEEEKSKMTDNELKNNENEKLVKTKLIQLEENYLCVSFDEQHKPHKQGGLSKVVDNLRKKVNSESDEIMDKTDLDFSRFLINNNEDKLKDNLDLIQVTETVTEIKLNEDITKLCTKDKDKRKESKSDSKLNYAIVHEGKSWNSIITSLDQNKQTSEININKEEFDVSGVKVNENEEVQETSKKHILSEVDENCSKTKKRCNKISEENNKTREIQVENELQEKVITNNKNLKTLNTTEQNNNSQDENGIDKRTVLQGIDKNIENLKCMTICEKNETTNENREACLTEETKQKVNICEGKKQDNISPLIVCNIKVQEDNLMDIENINEENKKGEQTKHDSSKKGSDLKTILLNNLTKNVKSATNNIFEEKINANFVNDEPNIPEIITSIINTPISDFSVKENPIQKDSPQQIEMSKSVSENSLNSHSIMGRDERDFSFNQSLLDAADLNESSLNRSDLNLLHLDLVNFVNETKLHTENNIKDNKETNDHNYTSQGIGGPLMIGKNPEVKNILDSNLQLTDNTPSSFEEYAQLEELPFPDNNLIHSDNEFLEYLFVAKEKDDDYDTSQSSGQKSVDSLQITKGDEQEKSMENDGNSNDFSVDLAVELALFGLAQLSKQPDSNDTPDIKNMNIIDDKPKVIVEPVEQHTPYTYINNNDSNKQSLPLLNNFQLRDNNDKSNENKKQQMTTVNGKQAEKKKNECNDNLNIDLTKYITSKRDRIPPRQFATRKNTDKHKVNEMTDNKQQEYNKIKQDSTNTDDNTNLIFMEQKIENTVKQEQKNVLKYNPRYQLKNDTKKNKCRSTIDYKRKNTDQVQEEQNYKKARSDNESDSSRRNYKTDIGKRKQIKSDDENDRKIHTTSERMKTDGKKRSFAEELSLIEKSSHDSNKKLKKHTEQQKIDNDKLFDELKKKPAVNKFFNNGENKNQLSVSTTSTKSDKLRDEAANCSKSNNGETSAKVKCNRNNQTSKDSEGMNTRSHKGGDDKWWKEFHEYIGSDISANLFANSEKQTFRK